MKRFFFFERIPFIIAEAGVNHNGSLKRALEMIDIAKEADADCIKFQSFTAKNLVIKSAELVDYQKSEYFQNQFDLLSSCELHVEDFVKIKERCDQKGIIFLSTPFSSWWAKILFEMGISFFKLGSGNLNEIDLLRTTAQMAGQMEFPVVVSTGMSSLDEIRKIISFLRENGAKKIILLHCVSLYPTAVEKVNLFSIRKLEEEFNLLVGFSDHTKEIFTGALAVAAGAVILEKHFTISKKLNGPDHDMSLEPNELKSYIEKARRAKRICGEYKKELLPEELVVKKKVTFSIVAKCPIFKGMIIKEDMLCFKRPGIGISPFDIDKIIGLVAKEDIEFNELITYKHLCIR